MRASVIVATRNRAGLLDECLAHLAVQNLAEGAFEVVIVDNGSSDHTPLIAQRWVDRSSIFRYCTAPIAGLSIARNEGIAAARGEVVAFVDDDARPVAGWLRALMTGYERWADVASVGGPIESAFPRERPRWLSAGIEPYFGTLDYGDEPRLLEAGERLNGSNMSFRKDSILGVGGFSTDLGRVGGSLLSNEETRVFDQLLHAGEKVGYEPTARVTHLVHEDRLRIRWLLKRTLAQGRSDFIQDRLGGALPTRRVRARAAMSSTRNALLTGWRANLKQLRDDPMPSVLADSLGRRSSDIGYAWAALRSLALPDDRLDGP